MENLIKLLKKMNDAYPKRQNERPLWKISLDEKELHYYRSWYHTNYELRLPIEDAIKCGNEIELRNKMGI